MAIIFDEKVSQAQKSMPRLENREQFKIFLDSIKRDF